MERISLLELKMADVLRDVIDEEGILEGSDRGTPTSRITRYVRFRRRQPGGSRGGIALS